jgi:putative DNA primase/helicase
MSRQDDLKSYYAPVLAQLEDLTWHQSGNAAANCPAHADRTHSLSVKFGRNNELLVRCHSDQGCSFEAVSEALQRPPKDFFFQAEGNYKPSQRIEAIYDYVDENGVVLYQSVRFIPKHFIQRRPDGAGGWINNLDGVRRVPFRLNEIAAAPKDRTVLVFEGERKVECAESLGLLATCNAGGSEKWLLEWAPIFKDRPLCIFPDHDERGWRHAATVAKCLVGSAKPLRIVELPGMRLKDDVLDWRRRYEGENKQSNAIVVREALIEACWHAPLYDPANDPQVKLNVLRMEIAKALAMSGVV